MTQRMNQIIDPSGENYNPREQLNIQTFFYSTIKIPSLAAGASRTLFIQIEANSDFVIQKSTYYCQIAGAGAVPTVATVAAPDVDVNLIDTGSSNRITSQPTTLTQQFGTGARPYIWPKPRRMVANSTLQIEVTNNETVAIEKFQLSFQGFKVFSAGM